MRLLRSAEIGRGLPIAANRAAKKAHILDIHSAQAVEREAQSTPRVVGVWLGVLLLRPDWICCSFKHFCGDLDSDLGQTRSPSAALAPAFDGSCASRTLPRCPSLHPHGAAPAGEMQ